MTYELIRTIYRDRPGVIEDLCRQIDQGADLNYITGQGDTALRVASNKARFDVVRLLLRSGADPRQLGWTKLFFAIATGTPDQVEACLAEGADLAARDWWDRTPWLLSLQTGVVAIATALLAAGSDPEARGRAGKTPLAYAIEGGSADMVRWLLGEGIDVNASDSNNVSALMTAAKEGATDCVRALLEAGADPFLEDGDSRTAIGMAANLGVVNLLLDAGADVGDLCERRRAELLGVGSGDLSALSENDYRSGKHRRFGDLNPERTTEPFWDAMVRSRKPAYGARQVFNDTNTDGDPAVWCYARYGMSITALPDGRFIEIAGEHEDSYDPDFCIYNDVIVHRGGGDFDIYIYPKAVFPPTDFHSATLVGRHIYIVGNLGYRNERRPGETPVYRLDVDNLEIEGVETSGDGPGWIYKHKAICLEEPEIRISGGRRVGLRNGKQVLLGNQEDYVLCLKTLTWRRVDAV